MAWNSQATYEEGDVISIVSYLTAHHNGHCEVKACVLKDPVNDYPTQACFDANPLTFVSDPLTGMPKDNNYEHRGYYSGGLNGPRKEFEMYFKLPDNVKGDHVLLQW